MLSRHNRILLTQSISGRICDKPSLNESPSSKSLPRTRSATSVQIFEGTQGENTTEGRKTENCKGHEGRVFREVANVIGKIRALHEMTLAYEQNTMIVEIG